jgi:hypothetical protein
LVLEFILQNNKQEEIMNITRAILDSRGRIIGNENVRRVSESKPFDSIFVSKEEKQEGLVEKINGILVENNLEVVDKFNETSVGNLRSFIGEKDYEGFQTTLA